MMQRKTANVLPWGILAALAAVVWNSILFERPSEEPTFYFLDVGQGDATLAVLPGDVAILTDAGPNRSILGALEKARARRYIDLAIISHPQLDHFNGFNYVLDTYRVGVVLINGRDNNGVGEWEALLQKIKTRRIPLIVLKAGDSIRHARDTVDILSPDKQYLQSGELNDTGLVEYIRAESASVLLTADIGKGVETRLTRTRTVTADILKVPHHGSKYSSSEEFLAAIHPRIAVIEVGARNTYGHPSAEAVARLASSTPLIFRTDRDGTIKIESREGKLKIFTEEQE